MSKFRLERSDFQMVQTLFRFVADDTGQNFAEYALILGAVAVVALAVLSPYKEELMASFQSGIDALRAARGG
jgi:Flp pilus assembly pilin Flp